MEMNLNRLIKTYGGQWVALNEELKKVVSSGKDVKKVFKKARERGVKTPYLFKIPTRLVAYIG